MKRVIVTGPTGEVGLALVEELLKNSIEVFAVVRPGSDRAKRLPDDKNLVIVECEIDKLTELPKKILQVCDVFFHLAWAYSRDHENVIKQYSNIGYTLDAVYAARDTGCKVFIGAGSQAEYGVVNGRITPDTPAFPTIAYGMAKLCAGQLSRKLASQLEIRHVWPRIISVYGPGDAESTMIMSVIRNIQKGNEPELTKGEQLWDFLYSKDCAKAMVLLAEKGRDGNIYCIGSGKSLPLHTFIKKIRDIIDPDVALGFGKVEYSKNQIMKLDIDISTLVKDTGFEPEYDFETGIRETIRWCELNPSILKQEEKENSLS